MTALKVELLLVVVLASTVANLATLLVNVLMGPDLLVEEIPLLLSVAVGVVIVKLQDSALVLEETEVMEVKVDDLSLAIVAERMAILLRIVLNKNLLATTVVNQDTLCVIALSPVLSVELVCLNAIRVEALVILLVIVPILLRLLVISADKLAILLVIVHSNFFTRCFSFVNFDIFSCSPLAFSPTKTLTAVLDR